MFNQLSTVQIYKKLHNTIATAIVGSSFSQILS